MTKMSVDLIGELATANLPILAIFVNILFIFYGKKMATSETQKLLRKTLSERLKPAFAGEVEKLKF